jgi:predicted phage terminase large subunit-like protein
MEAKFGAKFKATKFGYFRSEKAVMGRWLHSFGLGRGAKGKRIPASILASTVDVRSNFLAGFMAADGCVRERGNYRVMMTCLSNLELTNDLRLLARTLGHRVSNVSTSTIVRKPPHSSAPRPFTNHGFVYHIKRTSEPFTLQRVREIKSAGREVVYDLTIEGTENFVADGLVVHNTRWHSDDIIGRLTDPKNDYYNEDEAKEWKIIRLPGLAEEDDVLGRPVGKALWPEKFDEKYHESDRRRDPLGFAALVQQRPTVADGIMFRRENIKRYGPGAQVQLPDDLRYYCSSDHAVGEKQRNDPSCFIKVGVDKNDDIYVLECAWKRMQADAQVETMLAMAGGQRRPLLWWAERGHISKAIGPFLRKRMLETSTYINLVEVTPAVDKQQRAQSIAGRVAMGKVYFPNEKWADDAIEELLAFPNGNHDDFVDALAYIGLGLQSQFGPSRAEVKPKLKENTFAWLKKQEAHQQRRMIVRG